MRPVFKRKQIKENLEDSFYPYKKRLVCEFSNMHLEEPPRFFEKKIIPELFSWKKDPKETSPDHEMKKHFIPKLTWNEEVKEHVGKIIKPDLVIEKIMNFYEKDRYAVVLYDEKKIMQPFWKNDSQEEEKEMRENSDNCKQKIKCWSCFDDMIQCRPNYYVNTAIEIEE